MNLFNILVCIFSFWVIWYIVYFYRKKWFQKTSLYGIPFIVLFASLVFSWLAFLNYKFNFNQKENIQSSNIVFVLDVSKSMLVLDYGEKSRLDVAKNFIKNYILNNPNNRYGLTIFSWDVSGVIPLTSDKKLFLWFLDSTNERSILNGWTHFPQAIEESIHRFDSEDYGWAIILLSDFETNLDANENKTLLHTLSLQNKNLKQKEIKFVWVWVWSEKWWKIPESYDVFWNIIYKKDELWKTIISYFDNEFFTSLTKNLNGISYKINDFLESETNISFQIPGDIITIENSRNDFVSRYMLMISYLLFLTFLYLYFYFEKKWK